jgi:peptide-methionine (S)-S-oxide reductase
MRLAAALVLLTLTLACAADNRAAGTPDGTPENDHAFPAILTPEEARAQGLDVATFAAGCFWCVETAFEGLPGVRSVVSGYTGGPEASPTYEQVSSGATGHAEAVQVVFDPKRTSYAALLEVFWHNVDPFAVARQFCDAGQQYRSAIFVHDAGQRALAGQTRDAVAKRFGKSVATQVHDAGPFWPAENYHQDFWKKSPVRYKTYRFGCGRDARLRELWGEAAAHRTE